MSVFKEPPSCLPCAPTANAAISIYPSIARPLEFAPSNALFAQHAPNKSYGMFAQIAKANW